MNIVIQVNAPEPVYEQIVRQIHDAVKSGKLKANTPLPTVRQLADDLAINRNTVARAYRILEEQGVTLTAGRKGTFIRQDAEREVVKVKTTRAERVLRRVIKSMLVDGMSRKEIADLFDTALRLEARQG
ncbi:MAG TPA: GntR family transcriptional regulator [Vicinamibacterales bacterium]|jgi:GntR family transcriptional regulator